MAKYSSTQNIQIENIRLDGGTQPPERMDLNAVKEYAELMEGGVEFPPPVVFFDGEYAWLAHGFHRLAAMKENGKAEVTCEVWEGTVAEARDYAHSANRDHGVRLTRAQKRWMVEDAIKLDTEIGRKRSDRDIAAHCGASHTMVSAVRKELAKLAKRQRDGAGGSGSGGGGGGGGNFASAGDTGSGDAPAQTPSTPVPDDGVIRDKLDVPVPDQFKELFTVGVAAFDGAMKAAKTRSQELMEWTKAGLGVYLRQQQIKEDCKREFEHLKFARPWCVCPDCRGSGCGSCANNGWMSYGRHQAWLAANQKAQEAGV